MNAPLRQTYTDAARTLTSLQASMTKPLLLHDALDLKRARGDADCELFAKIACDQFGSGLNATVQGGLDALKQWKRKGIVGGPAIEAFMADLQAIEQGTFGRRAA
jgi:hypothetical protein